ncbi:MAG: Crp/Fnr family transcriptional regulator [Spirochaetes bacterium]|nr:Crp/Fnr family transcriptional regulator [Spirochaetota bacterium]
MNPNIERLKYTSLFKGFDSDELTELFSNIQIVEKKYKKGSIILIQDEPYNDLFILIDGTGYAEMVDYSGKNVKIEDLKAPYIVATAILFAKDNKLPVSVTAKNETTVLIIKKDDILKISLTDSRFLKNLLTDISNKFTFIAERLSFLGFKTIREKIANYLLSLKKDKNSFVKIPVNLEELSDFLAIARPSLSRTLMELENEGIIKKNNKMIRIIDQDKLIQKQAK